MNVDTDLCITLRREEAVQLRTALHIATRLCALAPNGYGQPVWARAFSELHESMCVAEVDILPGAPAFSDDIIAALSRSESDDDRLLRDLFARPLTVGYGMREMDFAAIEARVMACLLDPIPPLVIDASQLPFEFMGTVTGRNVMPGPAMPDNLPRKLPDVLMDDQSARHVGLTASQTGLVNKAEPKGWIVQFNLRHGSIALANWAQVRELGLPQRSRNAAYRALKARAKAQGIAEDAYRVVPAGTPDGPEKDRGFYTVEFFTKHGRPSELGWNKSGASALTGTFPTAGGAQNAIDSHISRVGENLRSRYRVKWHPSRA
ncbi:hypothetical protein HOR91_gp04 [Xanthomonas phage phi Xc10]|uniref:Uncharacterized protein n=1 Tax=Xanthomonas phage phi Xc10 TaxID=2024237 RepID=A0A249XLB8_9CAUD|nr:hypothetical protein HOR91_gp04 [Xanthomonas phage phi Xc10]ASZ72003.1 hypothetical protein [Xanthomonas phage phi Xc10]